MGSCILCIWWYSLKYPCPVRACVTNPGVCLLSVRNACDPAKEGGMRSAMAYRPVTGLFARIYGGESRGVFS